MATPSRDQLLRKARSALVDTGVRLRADLRDGTPHLEWVYGHDPRAPFPPHRALDGLPLESWEDPALSWAGRFPPVSHLYPGDHSGCLCTYEVQFDRSFVTATAWRVRAPERTSTGFSMTIENRRYKPEALRLPAPVIRAAAPGRAPIAVRARAQIPDRVAYFYRDVLSPRRVSAELTLALAVAR